MLPVLRRSGFVFGRHRFAMLQVDVDSTATTAVVGAPGQYSGDGAAYVFQRLSSPGTVWTELQILSGSSSSGEAFGTAVAISGNAQYVAVGATSYSSSAGHVYIYLYSSGSFSLQATVAASDASSNAQLGSFLSLDSSGLTLAAGAPGWSSNQGKV
jgi:hypothetical protein